MPHDINLDIFTQGNESASETEYGITVPEALGLIGTIDVDIQAMVGLETLNMGTSLEDKRKKLQSELCNSDGDDDELTKPKVVVHGNEHHLFFDETSIIFDDYSKRLFKFIASLDETDVLKIFFYYEIWPSDAHEFPLITSVISALHECKAKTIACVYNKLRLVPSMIALACDELVIGDYCEMLLEYPDMEHWGDYKVYKTVIDQTYERLYTRGIIIREEYKAIVNDHSKLIYLDSKTLKERV